MADSVYEVIIIGAGVEGSSTGYYLTSRCTSNVLLLEQVSYPSLALRVHQFDSHANPNLGLACGNVTN